MIRFVLFLFVNLSLSVHSNLYTNNNYSIQMTGEMNGEKTVQKIFKVLRNKSFNIKLANYIPTSARCCYNDHCFPNEIIRNDGNSTIKFKEATKDMTGQWQCTIETKGPILKPSFYVRVIGDPKEVQIVIAGSEINLRLSGSPELAYDELGIYYFKDGETIQLICNNINDGNYHGDIYLRYYDSKDAILLETDRIDNDESAFFQRTMKLEDNNHSIDCTFVTKNLTFPYRVVFKLINDTIDYDFTITINDLKLRPTNNDKQTNMASYENIRYYHFTYFRNQVLTVSFETSNELYGSIRFVDKNKKTPEFSSFKEIKTQKNNTVKFHTKSLEEENYILLIMKEGVQKSSPIAAITLNKSPFPELLITGLTAKDVINQYRQNRATWIIDYWYSVGELLHLSCISRDQRNLHWIVGTSVVYNEYSKIISHNFTLSEECNETLIIICEGRRTENYRRTIINLHRKSAYSVTTDYPYPTDEDSDNTILIVCAMVASILAITSLGFVFYCCRYRTAKSPQTTTDTLQNRNQYSTPIYSTPIARTSEQNYNQGYIVQNSLYEPKTFDNATAEYHYIDVNDIMKQKYATARTISPQADILYVNTLAKSQQNEGNDNSNRTTAEVEFNPRYANTVKGEEYPKSPINTGAYDYAYCIRYVNSNSGK